MSPQSSWEWFLGEPIDLRLEAEWRLEVVEAVEARQRIGMSRWAAVAMVSQLKRVNWSCVVGWLNVCEGTPSPRERLINLISATKRRVLNLPSACICAGGDDAKA